MAAACCRTGTCADAGSAAQILRNTSQGTHLERDGPRAAVQLPRVLAACLQLHLQARCCDAAVAHCALQACGCQVAMSSNEDMLCAMTRLFPGPELLQNKALTELKSLQLLHC